ncbi:MAG: hypothetical protein ACRDN9_20955 [Streptosporangiaceae bacterium]
MDGRLLLQARSAMSATLAAAICMAITQIVGLVLGNDAGPTLLYGFSLSSIAFGGTYAGTFFVGMRSPRRDEPAATAGASGHRL